MSTQIELNTDKLHDILKKVQALPSGSGAGQSLIATMQIPENQSITVEITEYTNNVTMEGETV